MEKKEVKDKMELEDYFPFDDYRSNQKEVIQRTVNAISNGKKFIIIDAGTGFGKSAVARNIIDYYAGEFEEKSYLLTNTHKLQEQYYKEFYDSDKKHGLVYAIGKGRGNYYCRNQEEYHGKKVTCDKGRCQTKDPYDKFRCFYGAKGGDPCENGGCYYWKSKASVIEADAGLMNYDMMIIDSLYVEQFPEKKLMICDECHNIESKLMGHISLTLNHKKIYGQIDYDLKSKMKGRRAKTINYWVKELHNLIKQYNKTINRFAGEIKSNKILSEDLGMTTKTLENHKKMVGRLEFIIKELTSNPNNWVVNVDTFKGNVEFKPVTIGEYSEDLLFNKAEHYILLSATIIDFQQFCKDNGIPIKDAIHIRGKSEFSPKNTPIVIDVIGNFNRVCKEGTKPLSLPKLEEILERHKNQKGLIHANSREFANYIMENLDDDRLMTYDSSVKDDTKRKLSFFEETDEPRVLVSYSMTEGVDLPYDKLRFQIIYKMPYGFLGDNQVKKRKNSDPKWYALHTIKTLVQAHGRGMRAEDDYCVTYILDSSFNTFFYQNRNMFPQFFKEAITQKKKVFTNKKLFE